MAFLRVPRLLADILRAAFVSDDVHIDLVGDESQVQLRDTEGRPHHDVVIACADDPWLAELTRLLDDRHDLVVVGVHPSGRNAWIYEFRPRPRPLGAVNTEQLRQVVLDALAESA